MAGRRDFVRVLREVATRHDLAFRAMSHDWVIQISDPKQARVVCNVFGYTFDINGAGAAEVCKEKAATSLVLGACGIPNVEHRVFLNPNNPSTTSFVPLEGNTDAMRQLIEGQLGGLPVVIKPLKGSGGLDVIKAESWRDVEAAVQSIFCRDYGVAVSAYKKIKSEYRCVCLDDRVYVVYNKIRNAVVGDGASTVAQLASKQMEDAPAKLHPALFKSLSELSPEMLAHVPAVGESVVLQWKHNLGQGASAQIIAEESRPELTAKLQALALEAVHAVGMRFCSVDIIDVEDEGLMVMEINSGVMMDALISQLGTQGEELAYEIYETAVLKTLQSRRHSAGL